MSTGSYKVVKYKTFNNDVFVIPLRKELSRQEKLFIEKGSMHYEKFSEKFLRNTPLIKYGTGGQIINLS